MCHETDDFFLDVDEMLEQTRKDRTLGELTRRAWRCAEIIGGQQDELRAVLEKLREYAQAEIDEINDFLRENEHPVYLGSVDRVAEPLIEPLEWAIDTAGEAVDHLSPLCRHYLDGVKKYWPKHDGNTPLEH